MNLLTRTQGGAQLGASMQTPPVLVVTGEGSVQVVPDVTVVSLGVTARDSQAAAAFQSAAVALNQVVRALLAGVISRDQIQTSQISLQQVFQNDRPVGYEATANLRITLRDRTAIGDAIDRAVAAGANNVTGISFELADPGGAEAMALAKAVQNAQGQAAVLARSLGLVLGPVLRVEAESAPGPIVPVFARAAVAEAIPILPGTITVIRRVRVEFMIVR